MASARYTLNIDPEDLKPDEPIEYTKKQKMANWWHYNWKIVAVIVVLVAIAGHYILKAVTTVHPDEQIALVSAQPLPSELQTALEQALGGVMADSNGDGQVLVQVDTYTIDFTGYAEPSESEAAGGAAPGAEQDAADVGAAMTDVASNYEQVASLTRLTADIQDNQTLIFLLDDPAGFQEVGGVLASSEGAAAPDPKSLEGVDLFLWEDCPALTGLELGEYTDMLGQNAAPSEALFQGLALARRGFAEGKELKTYGAENEAFFKTLIAGAKAQ